MKHLTLKLSDFKVKSSERKSSKSVPEHRALLRSCAGCWLSKEVETGPMMEVWRIACSKWALSQSSNIFNQNSTLNFSTVQGGL